jgi:hypothetical protein
LQKAEALVDILH